MKPSSAAAATVAGTFYIGNKYKIKTISLIQN